MNFANSNGGRLQEHGVLNVDPRRIVGKAIRYWYVLCISIVLFVGVAHTVNRYSTKVHAVNASIIIKESEEVSGGDLLYNNPLVKFYRNYQNELYIIKSIPLLDRTVRELEFEGAFYTIGNFLTSESYRLLPFHVEMTQRGEGTLQFLFEVVGEREFQISYTNEQKEEVEETIEFGEPISIGDWVFSLKIHSGQFTAEFVGEHFQFLHRPALEIAREYEDRLVAAWAEEGAGVINLSIKGSNPKKEVDFISGLIRNYQDYDLERKNETATNTIRFIDGQLESISDSLDNAERQLELFKNRNIVTDLNSEALRLYQKMEGLEVQKTDLIIRDSYYNYLIDYISNSEALDQAILPSSVGITDPILSALMSEMIKIQTDIKLFLRTEKTQSPLVADAKRRIQEIKDDILESVRNQKSMDDIKLNFLDNGIKEIEKQLGHLPIAERQLVKIKRNYSLLENLHIFLLQKKAEAGISRASNTSDIVVVNPPMAEGPISPDPVRNYLVGLFGGLSFPFLVFFLVELFNTRVQSREEIGKLTSAPFIGGIGHKRSEHNIEVFRKPKSAISESFRSLRSSLRYFLEGRDGGVFLITSSISGEGKSFVTINLASVFAISGKRTLIVGGDMRKPKMFSDFGFDNAIGLSNYLAGLSEFDDVIRETPFENLYMVSGGPIPPNPSELMLSERMKMFLDLAKSQFDYILIDSPPLGLVSDAFTIVSEVDHTLFIVRQNYTPKVLLSTMNDLFEQGKLTKMSVVLNDIRRSGSGYGYAYGYGYSYGYGYGYDRIPREATRYYED